MVDGESVVSFPSTSLCQSSGRDVHWIEDIGPILEVLSQMTWKEWGLYRQYVIGRGLISGLVVKNIDMSIDSM